MQYLYSWSDILLKNVQLVSESQILRKKKAFPGSKNLFLIYKDKIVWLYGLGEDKLKPFGDINLQRSAYRR